MRAQRHRSLIFPSMCHVPRWLVIIIATVMWTGPRHPYALRYNQQTKRTCLKQQHLKIKANKSMWMLVKCSAFGTLHQSETSGFQNGNRLRLNLKRLFERHAPRKKTFLRVKPKRFHRRSRPFRKNDPIRFCPSERDEWSRGKLISRKRLKLEP